MPVENMEEEGLAKNPDLLIAQWKFQLESVPSYKVDRILFLSKSSLTFLIILYFRMTMLSRRNYWESSKKTK